MSTWDLALAGCGVAGSLTLLALADGPRRRLLIVDPTELGGDDRTFGFWANRPTPLDALATQVWRRQRIRAPDLDVHIDLGDWRYLAFRVADLRRAALDAVAHWEVEWIDRAARSVDTEGDSAVVRVANGRHRARHALDSRFDLDDLEVAPGRTRLVQSFEGWWVETDRDAFDPEEPVIMDFRLPCEDALRFHYVVAESTRRALVHSVTIGPERSRGDVERYLRDVLDLERWTTGPIESGATPMTDYRFPRQPSPSVLRIGIAGGRLRPSTGYGVPRMLADAEAIARSFEHHDHPFDLPVDPWLPGVLDTVLLRVIAAHGPQAASVFPTLFARAPTDAVLRVVSGRPGVLDAARVAWPMRPWSWFVEAALGTLADRMAGR